jgi:hypothetical protein
VLGARSLVPIALALGGCILFVSPDSSAPHCTFPGEDTPCGACLVASCQSAVDATCSNDAAITTLGECAEKGDLACGEIPESLSCLMKHCGPLCYNMVGLGRSITTCADSNALPGAACSCTYGGAANTFECSTQTYPNTLCCAPLGWPAAGLTCACEPIACYPVPGGCSCTLADHFEPGVASMCSAAGQCCAVSDSCKCGAAECVSERPVGMCDLGQLRCPSQTTAVPSCTKRE